MDVNPYQSPVEDQQPELDTEGQHFLASRGSRFAAALLDGIVMLVIILPIQWATGMFETVMRGGQLEIGQQMMWAGIGFAVWFVVQVAFLVNGQTLGKKALGIRMVDYSTGERVPLGRLVGLRYLPTQLVSSIPTIGPLLNLVNILFIFGSEQRCIHDLIAGTKVVQA